MTDKIPIIILQGPTAVGKSELALKIARKLETDIISADSRQIYKFLDIGTAKPSLQVQKEIKHHLIDLIEPDESYNAGRFSEDATSVIRSLQDKGKVPFIVGGTGFYVKALVEGLAVIPKIPAEVRHKIEKEFPAENFAGLHQKLALVDPIASAKIKENDRQKIIRALEVYEFTGYPISYYWEQQEEKKIFRILNIFLTDDREKIYQRINDRIDKMLNSGLLKEIESLLSSYKATDPGMNSVGYKEFLPFFFNRRNLDICIEEAKKDTRNLAKRQFTWYKKIEFDLTLNPFSINISYITEKIKKFALTGDL